ncbi:hypothetical protein VKT23_012957 [Stygiomarasmius scandens]|uniref:Nephrocystin 3-like N-terminal domain-containing protein n=1 Tax=Marasmiellus scandens TaxID=2682957 RepID=A0ABR1J5B6_9AGAR
MNPRSGDVHHNGPEFLQGAHHLAVNHFTANAVEGDQNNYTTTHNTHNTYGPPPSKKEIGLQRLYELVSQVGALHDAAVRFPPPKCHPGTREEVLQSISDWAIANSLNKARKRGLDTDSPPFYWLYGPAGAGKSAIAQTLCETFDVLRGGEHLAASFFFSRSSPARNNPKFLFLTIAFCLATYANDTSLRAAINKTITKNPAVLDASIDVQFQELVVKPLRSLWLWRRRRLPKLVIIDGLDECTETDAQRLVLETIRKGLVEKPSMFQTCSIPLRFLIASRPEPVIRNLFSQPEFYSISNRTVLDDSLQTSRDIKLYLVNGFARIAEKYQDTISSIPETWPPSGAIEELVQRASGQFIYASTVLKYVGDEDSLPPDRLTTVLELPPSDAHAFADLDILYHQILIRNPQQKRNHHHLCLVLLFVSLTRRVSNIRLLAQMFSLPEAVIPLAFRGLHSVLNISSDFVTMYHKSFADFLQDKRRSQEYHIDIGDFFRGCSNILRDSEGNGTSFMLGQQWDELVDDRNTCFRQILASNPDTQSLIHFLGTLLWLQTIVPGSISIALLEGALSLNPGSALEAIKGIDCLFIIKLGTIDIRLGSFKDFLLDVNLSKEYHIDISSYSKDLDPFYRQICSSHPSSSQILGFTFLTSKATSLMIMGEIFSLPEEALPEALQALQPVLKISFQDDRVSIFHTPFLDFLQNPQRSGKYHVNANVHRENFLRCCNELFVKPDHVFRTKVENWCELVDDPYSCFKEIMAASPDRNNQMRVLKSFLWLQSLIQGPTPIALLEALTAFPVKTTVSNVLQGLKLVLKLIDRCVDIRFSSFERFLLDSHLSGAFFVEPTSNVDQAAQWCLKTLKQIGYQNVPIPNM